MIASHFISTPDLAYFIDLLCPGKHREQEQAVHDKENSVAKQINILSGELQWSCHTKGLKY